MSVFSKIVSGDVKAHVVAETVQFLAFLDVNPLTEGHVLVIPKIEVDYIFDMDEDLYVGLWMFAKIVAGGIKTAFLCEKVGISVIGLEVLHTHIHLMPINSVGDMNFSKEKLRFTEEELEATAHKIREALLQN
ncbi:histidine triad (HIT) family protein [Pedobacter sp. UYEF25]